LPCKSVMVRIVLLKVAWTNAMPWDNVRFSFRAAARLDPCALLAIRYSLSSLDSCELAYTIQLRQKGQLPRWAEGHPTLVFGTSSQ
jgi:hypothetical protein